MLADRPPPDVGGGPGDVARAIDQAWRLLRLPIEAKRDALDLFTRSAREVLDGFFESDAIKAVFGFDAVVGNYASRSVEHTSELQSLMRISYAVFCLNKKKHFSTATALVIVH